MFCDEKRRDDLIGGYNRMLAIKDYALRWCQGYGVDYGYGDGEAWGGGVEGILPGAYGVDIGRWRMRFSTQGYAGDFSDRKFPEALQGLDFIFSSHALEHISDWSETLKYWFSRLRPGGIVFLYLPHESIPEWRPEAYHEHKWVPTWENVSEGLKLAGFEVVEYLADCDAEGSFYVIGRRPSLNGKV